MRGWAPARWFGDSRACAPLGGTVALSEGGEQAVNQPLEPAIGHDEDDIPRRRFGHQEVDDGLGILGGTGLAAQLADFGRYTSAIEPLHPCRIVGGEGGGQQRTIRAQKSGRKLVAEDGAASGEAARLKNGPQAAAR